MFNFFQKAALCLIAVLILWSSNAQAVKSDCLGALQLAKGGAGVLMPPVDMENAEYSDLLKALINYTERLHIMGTRELTGVQMASVLPVIQGLLYKKMQNGKNLDSYMTRFLSASISLGYEGASTTANVGEFIVERLDEPSEIQKVGLNLSTEALNMLGYTVIVFRKPGHDQTYLMNPYRTDEGIPTFAISDISSNRTITVSYNAGINPILSRIPTMATAEIVDTEWLQIFAKFLASLTSDL